MPKTVVPPAGFVPVGVRASNATGWYGLSVGKNGTVQCLSQPGGTGATRVGICPATKDSSKVCPCTPPQPRPSPPRLSPRQLIHVAQHVLLAFIHSRARVLLQFPEMARLWAEWVMKAGTPNQRARYLKAWAQASPAAHAPTSPPHYPAECSVSGRRAIFMMGGKELL